ncbi:hypothetical protein BIV25_04225 [Streptomyces sp. MUSC 14]|uniref:hypothetical protein n=1 Tax=Streptomyces sp. MUSC 14 TaxID=1354889 RepID=UPI0008F57141|nr:hypothetical protein [Streptomyces sp. MUSC 14]OIK01984.1 hypothetical protein BIV25_04225 [Streptomyces sp. MUSC 14]
MTSGAADAGTVRAWLADVWSRTEAALILGGPDLGTPLLERPVAGEVFARGGLAELRALTATGDFTGDICRCPGSPTLALLDADAEFIGRGSLHGGTDVSWERGRFRNNLTVADPEGLRAFLERHLTCSRGRSPVDGPRHTLPE